VAAPGPFKGSRGKGRRAERESLQGPSPLPEEADHIDALLVSIVARLVDAGALATAGSRLTFRYKRHSFERATHVDFSGTPRIIGNHVVYETVVPPRGRTPRWKRS